MRRFINPLLCLALAASLVAVWRSADRRFADAERRLDAAEAARVAASREARELRNEISALQARVSVLAKYPPDPEEQRRIDLVATRVFDARYQGEQLAPGVRVSRKPSRNYSPWHLAFLAEDGRWFVLEYRRRYDGAFEFFPPPRRISQPPNPSPPVALRK